MKQQTEIVTKENTNEKENFCHTKNKTWNWYKTLRLPESFGIFSEMFSYDLFCSQTFLLKASSVSKYDPVWLIYQSLRQNKSKVSYQRKKHRRSFLPRADQSVLCHLLHSGNAVAPNNITGSNLARKQQARYSIENFFQQVFAKGLAKQKECLR